MDPGLRQDDEIVGFGLRHRSIERCNQRRKKEIQRQKFNIADNEAAT